MEAVALLHDEGYGRLKIYCYIKSGLGAWRHYLFAADRFLQRISDLPKPIASGSLPDWPIAAGSTAELIAKSLLEKFPELLHAAVGEDSTYTNWYRLLLQQYPTSVLLMERQDIARLLPGHVRISTPYEPLADPEYEE